MRNLITQREAQFQTAPCIGSWEAAGNLRNGARLLKEQTNIQAIAYYVINGWIDENGAAAIGDLRQRFVNTMVDGDVIAIAEVETEIQIIIQSHTLALDFDWQL